MMRINKLLLSSLLIIMLGCTAFAQNKPGISFGLRAGINYQNINGKDQNGDDLNLDMVLRYHGGMFVQIPLANQFFIQPVLLYSTKGAQSNENDLGSVNAANFNIGYLEVPLNFVYNPLLGKGRLLLGIGPYIAYGIAGNVEYSYKGNSTSEKIEFTDEYSSANPDDLKYFKPLDYGGNLLFGYQFAKGLSAQLNAQLGLAQIKADNTQDLNSKMEFRNTGFGLSLGYTF